MEEDKRTNSFEESANRLAEAIARHEEISKSVPPCDLAFVKELLKQYSYAEIRHELNKMHLWLLVDDSRKRENYRSLILTFLQNSKRQIVIQKGTAK